MSNQENYKPYQNRLFWLPIVISIITLIIVLYNPNTRQNDTELKEDLKAYIDSTNALIEKEIDNTAIEVLDIVYGDTMINSRR